MKKETIRNLILQRFRSRFKEGHNGFVNGQTISEIMHHKTGHKHGIIDRELRRMAEDGIIEKEMIKLEGSKVASIYYKYKPSSHEVASRYMQVKYLL